MRITCVHQGFELYGSDRSFVDAVEAIRTAWPAATVTVILPRPGPIMDALKPLGVTIRFERLWVLRRAGLLRLATVGLFELPAAILRAIREIRRSDLVYINTAVVTDYMLAARLFPGRALLHVHEIPDGAALRLLRFLVGASGAEVIFNSLATAAAYDGATRHRTHVIYNGIAGPLHPRPMTYDGNRPLRVLLLGRISRIKGQSVLAAALQLLPIPTRQRVEVRMVGSSFGDEAREQDLARTVHDTGLAKTVTLAPFRADPANEFQWADIVVVPSTLPESLGRVAIEAAAWGRPVLASAIGGLTEVVRHGETGWLVPPGDARALADALETIIDQPNAWRSFPAAARARYAALFRKDTITRAFTQVVAAKLDAAREPSHDAPLALRPDRAR